MRKPHENLNCLLVYPRFSQFSFWNTRESVALVGAKAPAPPLGLITVAALLPQNWVFRLVDLNTQEMSEEDWQWADVVCAGGMLPQQAGLLEIIGEAQKRQKFIAVGGPDPTSQPNIYESADALVMGEGEITIPKWLDAWSMGQPRGRFEAAEKPDVSTSPIPRFDLLKKEDYFCMGVQYARGCPFNCEFCDIIELFGRKPRHKNPTQLLGELDVLYEMGYRGYVEIVDDNFIGNKRHVKRELLPALIAWNKKRRQPFYFGVEASMNIGDDEKLLSLMEEANFRFVFMGIETPDPELLMMTQKTQNTMRPIEDRVQSVTRHGIIVTAGFIIGFDGEKPGTDLSIIKCIEDSAICMAMMGMLVALPNTQLTRRLIKEGRLMDFSGNLIDDPKKMMNRARVEDLKVQALDQTVAGLNYVPTRNRQEIVSELANIVGSIYSPEAYFARVLKTVKLMKYRPPRLASWYESKRNLKGFVRLCYKMTLNGTTRALFWKTTARALMLGSFRFEIALNLIGIYIHFQKHTAHLIDLLEEQRHAHDDVIQDMDELEEKWASGEIKPPTIVASSGSIEPSVPA